jgi:hypothetical protein
VAVIDELERQDGVQDGLDAGGGRIGVRHRGALLQDHVLIGHGGSLAIFSSAAMRTGAKPSRSMVARSQPLPFT